MSQQKLLADVVIVLETAGIEYMVTGSVVSSLQGEPRSTHDADVVVDLAVPQAELLLAAFSPPAYYLSEQSVREAIQRGAMFNLLSMSDGDKVDFWLLKSEPFDRSRFSRRLVADIHGVQFKVSTPEDTILAKLDWAAKSGGSEKQFNDALRVYELQYPTLDQKYLQTWAHQLNVVPLWERLKSTAEPLQ
jgi:hypothetical protein